MICPTTPTGSWRVKHLRSGQVSKVQEVDRDGNGLLRAVVDLQCLSDNLVGPALAEAALAPHNDSAELSLRTCIVSEARNGVRHVRLGPSNRLARVHGLQDRDCSMVALDEL